MLVMGLVSPVATIPQIVKLYFTHSEHAGGLSITTWGMYTMIALLWTIYGLYHQNPTIWVGNGFGFLAYLVVVVGIFIRVGWTF